MEKILRLILILPLIFIAGNKISAQQWQVYTSTNSGIAGNWILSLEKEDNGVYWIGTLSGLSRFNFHTWQNFYSTNSPLGRNEIHDIAIDPVSKTKWFSVPPSRSGTLWTLGGVYGYNDTTWTVLNYNNSPFINYKNYGIEIDSDRNLWISFSAYISGPGGSIVPGGVVRRSLNGSWSSFTTNSGLSWYVPEEFKADSNGIVYILQYGGPATSGIDIYQNGTGFIGSYTPQNSGLPSQNVRRVDFDRNNNIWIAGWGIVKYDRVNSWTHYTQSNSPILSDVARDVAIDSNNNIWIGTLAGLSKIDNNNNWTNYTTSNSPLPNNIIEALMVDGSNNVWIGTRGGLVIYNDSIITSVSNNTLVIPISHRLDQNYPNPFNPVTKISFSISSSVSNDQIINLSVFDVSGKKVSTIVNENLSPGNYEYSFNGSGLTSGVYFYRLAINDQFLQTKKMLLIK